MSTNTKATNVKEARDLLRTATPRSRIVIRGYQTSDGAILNLTVKRLEPGGYRKMQKDSLDTLRRNPHPVLPGVAPEIATKASAELVASLEKALNTPSDPNYNDGYVADASGVFSTTPGKEDIIYLLRMETLSEENAGGTAKKIPKGDVPRAKEQIKDLYHLPVGKYSHILKLVDGKFKELSLL